jgi:hypothetical protein
MGCRFWARCAGMCLTAAAPNSELPRLEPNFLSNPSRIDSQNPARQKLASEFETQSDRVNQG